MQNERSLGNRRDGLIILAILVVALVAAFLLYGRQPEGQGNYAVVYLDNKEIMRLALEEYEETSQISLQEGYGVPVNFQLENNKIRFYQVTCPDHLCEHVGFIGGENEIAVCLPNRTAVVIYTAEELAAMEK